MATLHDHRDTDHPALARLGEVHQALDRLHAVSPAGVRLPARAVAEVERALRRLEAYQLKLVAAADQDGAAADAGFTGTDSWVAHQTTTSRATAARRVELATGLDTGHETTAAALDQGLVSPAHAAVILHAGRQLPAGVSDQQRHTVEATLVEKAQRFDPDQLKRIARRAIEAVEPDQQVVDAHENHLIRSEEEAARDRCVLSLRDNGDGTTSGHFTIPTLAAAILGKVIDTMTAPRRQRDAVALDQGPSTHPPRSQAHTWDWGHRRGLAFTELLEHLPTDHLHPKTAATVVVTLDHETLQGALKAAHLDTGHTLSAGEARRLACQSGLIPVVLDTTSATLDLGREARLFSHSQRIAKGLQHDTCAADGCQRPYAWCELHHRTPWHRDGRTDLSNAIPLCAYHHQRIHDTAFCHHRLPDGSIRLNRRP